MTFILNAVPTTKRKGTQKGSHDMSKAKQFVFHPTIPLPRTPTAECSNSMNCVDTKLQVAQDKEMLMWAKLKNVQNK